MTSVVVAKEGERVGQRLVLSRPLGAGNCSRNANGYGDTASICPLHSKNNHRFSESGGPGCYWVDEVLVRVPSLCCWEGRKNVEGLRGDWSRDRARVLSVPTRCRNERRK